MLQSLADTWWAWIVLGFALGVLEILVPGYIFLGFAVGAILTGLLVATGLASAGPMALLLIFAVLSVIAWLGLRRTMGVRDGQVKVWDRDINDSK